MNLFGTVGVPGQYTAMAEMVGKPAAIGAKLILDGKCVTVNTVFR